VDKEFYQDLLDQISDGVYFVTRDRRITYWNGGAERITGYGAAEMLGHGCSEGTLRHVNDAGRQLCLHGCPLAGVMKDGKPRVSYVYLHHKDGHRVPVTVRGQALFDPDGTIVGSVEVFSARVDNPYAEQRRVHLDDSLDPVTGLPPRRLGELHLETLTRAVGDQAATLGVLFIDVDHFKDVNDAFGHRTGDDVLRMVARSLANGLRRGDVPMRWGGEEFLALLPGTSQAGLHATAERVRMLVENSWIQKGDYQARVTVSIGATMALAADSPEDLVERADRLMYASKHAGRNRITSEAGELGSKADRPILGAGVPWEMPGLLDLDGFGSGEPDPQGRPALPLVAPDARESVATSASPHVASLEV
jgi:diguanylate cyclase (GGDEF)-like protein/PAS domain S-box-containing protein